MLVNFIKWKKFSKKMKKFSIHWRKIIYTKDKGFRFIRFKGSQEWGKNFPIINIGGQIRARCHFWCRETLQKWAQI